MSTVFKSLLFRYDLSIYINVNPKLSNSGIKSDIFRLLKMKDQKVKSLFPEIWILPESLLLGRTFWLFRLLTVGALLKSNRLVNVTRLLTVTTPYL